MSSNPSAPSAAQLEEVKDAVRSLLHQPEYDDGSAGPVLVRLAWHASGTYDAESKTGGSNGAGMRYEKEGGDPANAGLAHARAFLEPVKEKFPWITYADLWCLASVVAIKEMGGPEISWQGGRTDFTDDSKVPPRGRLPDAAQGADHLAVDLLPHGLQRPGDRGAVGRPQPGALPRRPLGLRGQNDWKKKKLANGLEQFVYVDEELELEEGEEPEELMMLPTDMSLLSDKEFRPWVERYAKDKDLFFAHFAAVFGKLLELGLVRDASGQIVNEENVEGGYQSAPKKSDTADAPADQNKGQVGHEAAPLQKENEKFQKRKDGAKL
ncbi:hypothetical protein G7054_g2175 [Neopestalotiopsis clavispora]|nr:hypothetical protein G7054_g2175 [Neopestalotiopsis clavispora]